MLLTETDIDCPYCGEMISVLLDLSVERQDYIEDCSVCCRPIVLTVTAQFGALLGVHVRHEDEA
ncbi:MAG: CPXCG motif-containing cysteine-rich protein [Xanthomonadales bacterium]|nr:CPXCG motif-containing cysteine-rich protein [Xanthomonadales bacterium]